MANHANFKQEKLRCHCHILALPNRWAGVGSMILKGSVAKAPYLMQFSYAFNFLNPTVFEVQHVRISAHVDKLAAPRNRPVMGLSL